ncbi:hypothetical protein SAMN04489798_1437 [Pseudomonas arsenicoxydans]|uniref:Uncharacterized protein n=1 Tax=Pseudomonas arsenicoxydans TaxID=702115 RepID=A0A1H0F392_9PSED|nr:hypothetical protein SAMN04489798_1437 [Pseudomonas arsenicoxydans]
MGDVKILSKGHPSRFQGLLEVTVSRQTNLMVK